MKYLPKGRKCYTGCLYGAVIEKLGFHIGYLSPFHLLHCCALYCIPVGIRTCLNAKNWCLWTLKKLKVYLLSTIPKDKATLLTAVAEVRTLDWRIKSDRPDTHEKVCFMRTVSLLWILAPSLSPSTRSLAFQVVVPLLVFWKILREKKPEKNRIPVTVPVMAFSCHQPFCGMPWRVFGHRLLPLGPLRVSCPLSGDQIGQYPKIGDFKKWKFSFFRRK